MTDWTVFANTPRKKNLRASFSRFPTVCAAKLASDRRPLRSAKKENVLRKFRVLRRQKPVDICNLNHNTMDTQAQLNLERIAEAIGYIKTHYKPMLGKSFKIPKGRNEYRCTVNSSVKS